MNRLTSALATVALACATVSFPAWSARVINSVTLNGNSSVAVAPGQAISVAISVTTSGNGNNDNWDSVSYTVAGQTLCRENNNRRSSDGTYSENFSIDAPTITGSHTISFYAHRDPDCTPNADSNQYVLTDAITVSADDSLAEYLDRFNIAQYSNNDGSSAWADNWSESGDDNDPTDGDIWIENGVLNLQDDNVSITRSADLSGATSATLSFEFYYDLSRSDERLDMQISADGGSWVNLWTVTGRNETSGTFSADISDYISANTRFRFRTNGNLENSDDITIENFAVNTEGQGGPVDCPANGLTGTYYDQNGAQRAYFTGNEIVRYDPQVNFDWGRNEAAVPGLRLDDFSIRWQGYITPSVSGRYQFSTRSDDGIRLTVDGRQLINQWNDHAQRTHYSSYVTLEAGVRYAIQLEFYERGGHAVAELYWQPPGGSRVIIPSSNLDPGCSTSPPTAPTPIADFHFDEPSWDGTAGEVTNELGGGGTAINGIDTDRDGVICRTGSFPNTSSNSSYAVDTGIVPSTVANPRGTISFWYRSDSNWATNSHRTLFDASSNSKYFTLTLRNGYLRWGMEDPSDDDYQTVSNSAFNFSAGTWVHIAVAWDIEASNEAQVFVNGSQVAFNSDHLRQNTLGALSSLYVGDNRTNYLAWASPQAASGDIDEFMVFNQALSSDQIGSIYSNQSNGLNYDGSERECPEEFDHYTIISASDASTCVAQEVTVRAETVDNVPIIDYDEAITLSTSTGHGNWSLVNANGTLTPNPDSDDNGTANYQFVAADRGEITLRLSNSHAETLTITVGNGDVSSESSAITFRNNVFVIESIDSLNNDVVAGRNHRFRATMMRRDPDNGNCGAASEYNVASVKAWYSTDGSDPGGLAPSLISDSETQTLPNSTPGSANFTLPFVRGLAEFQLATNDVGRYSLRFEDSGYRFSDQDITTRIPGDSPTFTVRPFAIHLSVDGNPAASSANGSVFQAAGADFDVAASAVAWQSSDDRDDDGSPDGHADSDPSNNASLRDNAILPSFGQESEHIALDASLIVPTGGRDPGLGGTATVTAFNNGSGSTTNHFDEVGIIEIRAEISDGDYLQAGVSATAKLLSRSGYVGRFTPAYFTLDSSDIAPTCSSGGFSYLQQPMASQWSVSAHSRLGSLTENYRDGFIKLSASSGTLTYGAIDLSANTPLTTRLNIASHAFTWSSGSATVDTYITLERVDGLNQWDGPFTQTAFGLNLADSDGIGFQSTDFNLDSDDSGSDDSMDLGRAHLRYGRLVLRDAHGPESADLPAPFTVEFWNGQDFVINELDSCSAIPLSQIRYPDGLLSGGDFSVDVGSSSSTGSYLRLQPTLAPTAVSFVSGDAGQIFSAPGVGNTGAFDINVNLTDLPWLLFDWDGDGSYTDNLDLPTATVSFGRYRGHDRIIHWREIYN